MHAPSPPRRESTEDRRAAIASAARDLIVEKGVEGLRTRDIAQRVGINIATLHYHVPTKEALIGLVAETMRNEFHEQNLARPRAHLSPAEQLDHEFTDFRELCTERPQLVILLSELGERARRDEAARAAMRPMQAHWRQMVADILAAGRDDGSFRPDLDPLAAATMVIGTLLAFARSGEGSPELFTALCAELRRALRNPAQPVRT